MPTPIVAHRTVKRIPFDAGADEPVFEPPPRPGIVVVAGNARSGTTWLGKIFDSHHETVYRHEPEVVGPTDEIPYLLREDEYAIHQPALNEYIRRILATQTAKTSGALPSFSKTYRSFVSELARRGLILTSKVFARRLRHMPIGDRVLPGHEHKVVYVWKSVDSVGRLGFLAQNQPHARLVHLVRHPCGQIASTLRGQRMGKFLRDGNPGVDFPFLEKLTHCRPALERGLRYEDVKDLSPIQRWAWYWVLINEKAMLETEHLANTVTVAYEDLCAEPLRVARQLFGFCGLAWDARTESFIGQSTSRHSSRFYSVYKDPKRAALRWREELDPADVRQVAEIARESRPGRLFDVWE